MAGLALGNRRVNRRAVNESSVEAVDCLWWFRDWTRGQSYGL
jgi:hypothetical protein